MSNPAIKTFVVEATDLLEEMEIQLLELEENSDRTLVDSVFRALHTVKGSGAMFGFTILAGFTHHFENAFDLVREGRMRVSPELMNVSLKARDYMVQLLRLGGDTDEARALESSEEAQGIIEDIQRLIGEIGSGNDVVDPASPTAPDQASGELKTFEIYFKPVKDALHNGLRPDLLIEELAELGELIVQKDYSAIPALSDLNPTECHIGWTLTLTTRETKSSIEEVFIFVDDGELSISEIASQDTAEDEVVIDQASAQPRAGDIERKVAPGKPENIRVASQKLDDMMDRLGELVIAQERLNQIASSFQDPNLEGVVEEVERLVTGLRDTTLSIRMLPIEGVFNKFRRVVRDLSQELGKRVELSTSGGETEIDKNVIDRLSEPLVHMIRNSIDHGIEDAEGRIAAGKPAVGTVRLSAQQESGEILIRIVDDGAGLSTEAIRKRAVERGLIAEDAQISDSELHNLIFAPGFSTAEKLTKVSGRGVGMDAVKTTVDALKGSLDVESWPGRGTRITLRLPVSLAIIDGLLIRLGKARYVIPLASVEECVEFNDHDVGRESGRTMLSIRESLVPFLDLSHLFHSVESAEKRRRIVIVRADNSRLGLVVDDIIGQTQTVVKGLSVFHKDVEGFTGATILGDGTTALIIDVAVLVRSVHARTEVVSIDAARKAIA